MTWHKTNPIPTCNGTYLSDTEYCVLARESGTKIYGTYETKKKWWVSKCNVDDKKLYSHPTIKPLEIIKNLIINSSKENDVVLDAFMGSGTTAVACKELNRHFIGFELNPEFYEIANNRLNKTETTKEKAERKKEYKIFLILWRNNMNLSKLKDLKNKQQKIIADYLLGLAQNDECLMNKLLETDKTIQGCMSYIYKEARKQAENSIAFIENEVVYEWAKHYFLEDSLNCEPKGNKNTQEKVEKNNTNDEEEAEEIDDIENSEDVAEIEEKEESKPVKQKKTKVEKIKDKLYDGLDLFSME